MARIGLAVGRIGQGVPTIPPELINQIINRLFVVSKGAIDFQPRLASEAAESHRQAISAFYLHRETARLTRNPRRADRAHRVALLYANLYAPFRGALGVMFDRGFATRDDPNAASRMTAVPREGCAVFVQAIRRLRTPAAEDRRQIHYTTVHELGHLFNLVHKSHRPNFMAQSPSGSRAPPSRFFDFLAADRNWLRRAAVDSNVWPGGEDFQDRRDEASGDAIRLDPAPPIRVAITPSRDEFAYNEPVELTIELALGEEHQEDSLEIPNEIDPGYERFNIWIRDPDGELRRYRPINHYCSTGESLTLERTTAFLRDLSIFGQSGGFTFSKLGVHRLWVEFSIDGEQWIRSNKIELLVHPPNPSTSLDAEILRNLEVQSILFYRNATHLKDALNLASHVTSVKRAEIAAPLRYALARAFAAYEVQSDEPIDLAVMVKDHARSALDIQDHLGARQCHHLERLLSETVT